MDTLAHPTSAIDVVTSAPRHLDPLHVPVVLTFGVGAGFMGDALMRDSASGLGYVLWMALVVVGFVAVLWRANRAVSREVLGWLVVAVLAAAATAWRDAETIQLLDMLCALAALLMATLTANDASVGLFARRLRDTAWSLTRTVAETAAGFIPLVFREMFATAAPSGRRSRRWLRGPMIVLPLVVVFGGLLRGADPIFEHFMSIPSFDAAEIASHVAVIAILACVLSGFARNALLPEAHGSAPSFVGFELDLFEITTGLGTLNVLFGAYVLTQLGWLFGGERFLRATTGLSAAEYARRGFFQMVLVLMLVIPLLAGTRALVRPGRAVLRRHTLLSLPIIGLLAAIVLSAALRLRMYAHFYGLSTDRIYPAVFMAWLAFVLVWFAATVLRGWGRPFVTGSVISALLTLASVNVTSVDRLVARSNVERADRRRLPNPMPLDLDYLSRLSGESADYATRAVLAPSRLQPASTERRLEDAQRCTAATRLLSRWGASSTAARQRTADAAWRSRNAGETSALNLVVANELALRRVALHACRPSGNSRT